MGCFRYFWVVAWVLILGGAFVLEFLVGLLWLAVLLVVYCFLCCGWVLLLGCGDLSLWLCLFLGLVCLAIMWFGCCLFVTLFVC